MEKVLRFGLRAWRKIAGNETFLERLLKKQYRALRSRIERKVVGPNFVYFWAGSKRSRRIGIYARGSCDLLSLFSCQPLIQKELDGSCCLLFEGAVWDSSTALTLQALQALPLEIVDPVIEKLKLPNNYFSAGQLFKKTLAVQSLDGEEEFRKDVIVMSSGSDLIRTLYRHKEHGFLVDPGGWWFNQGMTKVLGDSSAATWFRKHFESVGRISADGFAANLAKIIAVLRERTDAHILVYNVLTIEPGSQVHDYRLIKNSFAKRAREFNLSLIELSRQLDFAIIDVDRALKRDGVSSQVDYAHFPPALYPAVAKEVFRVIKELGVL
jgi:hypothetical protein